MIRNTKNSEYYWCSCFPIAMTLYQWKYFANIIGIKNVKKVDEASTWYLFYENNKLPDREKVYRKTDNYKLKKYNHDQYYQKKARKVIADQINKPR